MGIIVFIAILVYTIYVIGSYIFMPFLLRGFCSFVGLRGSGKSNLGACIAQYWIKKGKKVYSNYPIRGTYQYDVSDLGSYLIEDCVLILDEAGIDMSNRKFMEKSIKGIKENNRRFWKLTRHYKIPNIYLFSQAFDYDVTLRRLCDRQYILTKSAIPNMTLITLLRQVWSVTEEGDSPCIKMEIVKFPHLRCYRKPWFKYYDSFMVDQLPNKEFMQYSFYDLELVSSSRKAMQHKHKKKLLTKYKLGDYNKVSSVGSENVEVSEV